MKPQDHSRSQSPRQWLIAAAAIAGVAVLTFILLKPDPATEIEAAPRSTAEEKGRPLPKFTAGSAREGDPPPAPVALSKTPYNESTACRECREKNRGEKCNRNMGCEGLAGEDLTLCQDLLTCLSAHEECFTKSPVLCYCGSAQGLACVKEPKGPCFQQALAATKTKDLTEAARRFFIPDFPSGRASQVAACGIRSCKDECGVIAANTKTNE